MQFDEAVEDVRTPKVLLTGDSGAGKTRLISTLANAGYRTIVADFDGKIKTVRQWLTEDGVKNFYYCQFTDPPTGVGATALTNYRKVIQRGWSHEKNPDIIPEGEELGSIYDWGPDTVFVVDTLKFMGDAAMRDTLARDGLAATVQPSIAHWGDAGRLVWHQVRVLTEPRIQCCVLVNSQIRYLERDDSAVDKGFPACVGSSLPKEIGGPWDDLWRVESKRDGSRVIKTLSDGRQELKCSSQKIPSEVKDPDLGKLFNIMRGK